MKEAYINGKVFTGTGFVSAFTVEDGYFTETGNDKEILSSLKADDRLTDLNGAFVCAGFNDSHMHLLGFGQFLNEAGLKEHTSSLKGLISYLRGFLSSHPLREGQWLTGRGWNQDYFSDVSRMPNRYDLDLVSEEIPIMITRTCGHSCVLNSKGLTEAGIDCSTKDPEGGTIGRDRRGIPDGRLFEKAMDLASPARKTPDKEGIKEMLLLAMKEANSYGITSVSTDDYCTFRDISPEVINEAYRELIEEEKATLRVTEQCNLTDMDALKRFIGSGNVTGKGGRMFRIGPLKLLGDGSLGSRTAHLSMPYLGTDGETGFSLYPPEQLKEMIVYAHGHGMQTAVHAIGDRCLDEVLDSCEKALSSSPPRSLRHGIVHCQISRPDQFERIRRLGMLVYCQSVFLDYDNHIVEKLVPKELAASSYSWKTLLNKGVNVSNGSDCPVELPDVMKGIRCAVTRKSLDGTGPFLPGEAFTVAEALISFTAAGAFASFEEDVKGMIRKGMLADFTVLDGDPFASDPEEIGSIKASMVYLGGKKVYGRVM